MSPWNKLTRSRRYYQAVTLSIVTSFALLAGPLAFQASGQTAISNSIVQPGSAGGTSTSSSNLVAQDTGVAVNGDANGSSINSNKNTLTTGTNTNLNLVAPTVVAPNAAQGGVGGNAVLMLPRNPLPLSNAALGRSNFGIQFGVQNNPILGGLGGYGGNSNALGWFLQAGLTIPFGKIPDGYKNQNVDRLDDMRQADLERRRDVFGRANPDQANQNKYNVKTNVDGRITSMGAYNYATIPSAKIDLPQGLQETTSAGGVKVPQEKLLAMTPGIVYSKPLNVGQKIGVIGVGDEYQYLGHISSGWIKILLPDGQSGWTSTRFEYIKNDYTEVDTLTLVPTKSRTQKTAMSISLDTGVKQGRVNREQ